MTSPGDEADDADCATAALQMYGELLSRRTPQEVAEERALIESSNDIALRDAEW